MLRWQELWPVSPTTRTARLWPAGYPRARPRRRAAFYSALRPHARRCPQRSGRRRRLGRGERIGSNRCSPNNGELAGALHFQLIIDLLDLDRDFPGVALASRRDVWRSLSPDPMSFWASRRAISCARANPAETLAARRARIGRNLSISYRQPLKIVRGWKQYLYMRRACLP